MTRDDIIKIQTHLRNLGFEPGPIDGVMGPHTESAIIAFKRSRGLKATAYVGPITMRALFTGSTEKAARPDSLPWIAEARKVLGLHEVRDNSRLRKWLGSDGHALGDPAKLPWCFRGDVEIMTEEGWQRFDQLTAIRVWQVDADGRMDLTEFFPVEKEYDGDLDVIQHRSFTLHADAEHRWWGQWGTSGRARAPKEKAFGTLSDMTTQGLRVFPSYAGGPGCGLSSRQIEIAAAILSDGTPARKGDGTIHEYRVQVSRPAKIKALHALGPDQHYVQPRAYGPLTTKPLDVFAFRMRPWMPAVITDDKELDRDFINSMNMDDARSFLKSYRKFDGTAKRFHLYTSSEQRRDDLLQIAVMAGWTAGVTVKTGAFTDRPCYEIHVGTGGVPRCILPNMVEREKYVGKLYCVTVPQGRIVVRERGRGAIVTGNCGDFVETAIRLALPNEPIPQNPYWALNWRGFGVPSAPTYGAVASISRNGGGHVGFIVGQDAGRYYMLGGNQSNAAIIVPVEKDRFKPESFRWPATYPARPIHMPYMTSAAAANTAES